MRPASRRHVARPLLALSNGTGALTLAQAAAAGEQQLAFCVVILVVILQSAPPPTLRQPLVEPRRLRPRAPRPQAELLGIEVTAPQAREPQVDGAQGIRGAGATVAAKSEGDTLSRIAGAEPQPIRQR